LDVDLARLANRFGQSVTGDLAPQHATIASLSTGARKRKSRSPRATIASSIGV
jgi:hypothetical protein